MGLKLFHITEFAESLWISPASQREASHPWVVILLASLWLAIPGNWVLWRSLSSPPGNAAPLPWWPFLVTLPLLMTCSIGFLLSFFNWRWTLKPVIILLLLFAALNTHLQLTQDRFVDASLIQRVRQDPVGQLHSLLSWQLFFTLSLLTIAPTVWLCRKPMRRAPLLSNLTQNIVLLLVMGSVLLGLWLANQKELSSLSHSHPQFRAWLNPFNSIHPLTNLLMSPAQSV